jgi:hypothetical protein
MIEILLISSSGVEIRNAFLRRELIDRIKKSIMKIPDGSYKWNRFGAFLEENKGNELTIIPFPYF